jgi:hypothetical protein
MLLLSLLIREYEVHMAHDDVIAIIGRGYMRSEDPWIADSILTDHNTIDTMLMSQIQSLLIARHATIAYDSSISAYILFVACDIVPIVVTTMSLFECPTMDTHCLTVISST